MRLIEERLETGALLKGYIHDTSQKMEMTFSMPAVVIFPGGSYERCSVRESEPVALAFMARGYNAFTDEYLTGERPPGNRPLADAAAAVKAVKCKSGRWNVNREKIVTVAKTTSTTFAPRLKYSGNPRTLRCFFPCILLK